ncbi:PREDICTED: probable disease resistance [Prunus dulcis]|uniref:PREDICTED: probable disease resistance n=2 Tax=Prunus dulcis TaxID=3755 RepID=A0A5E4E1G8_PRUDU|nr:PREDICTED: probable disease resistance [Prunus dulcis]
MFKTHLRDLKFTMDSFQQVDEDVRQHPNILFRPIPGLERFRIQMKKGVELVDKCSKVRPWKLNAFKKPIYTSKLVALNASLNTLLSVLTVHIISDTRARVIDMATTLNQIDANIVAQYQNQNQGWCAIPEPPPFTVGLDVHVEELKMELLKDEASMLVVTGLGGCGKTTLAQKICKDQKVKEKFKGNLFFVIVSKKSNCLVLQELCRKTGSLVPSFQEEAIAFNWLQEFLNTTGQDPLLLVLDDVTPGSDSLLDKLDEFKRPNHNILVTSRVQFPRFGPAYLLGTLEPGDAMTLFRHSASRSDRSSYIPDNLAEQIVQHCKGFPLAITTIGRSVCEQPTEIWEKRVAELSKGSSILDSEDYLLACLQSSLDALDEQMHERMPIIKECFIDLALFPEHRSIPAVALIDMWAELYGLDKDSWSITNIHELTNRNLANLVTRNGKTEIDGYYSEHFVTQHDMLRNLAIHQIGQDEIGKEKRLIIDICSDNLPKWWTEQKNKPKKTRSLSISTDGLSSEKWHDMHLPKAEVLVLNFQTENYGLPKFVKKMSKLKVLIVTNYGVLQADLSNFKLLGSLANLKRIRLERISIPSIRKNSMQLKSLQKISLFMCSIGQTFSNSSIQILEAFPNLVELNIDYCDDLVELPVKICDLIRLKKLSITNCHKLSSLPEEIGKLEGLEVLRLRSCTDLVKLPGSIKDLTKLHLLDIYKCFSIKELPEDIGEMSGLEKINIGQCSRLQELPVSVLNLGELREVICDEYTENLWGEPFKSNLTKTKISVVKEDFNLNWLHNL